MIAENLKDYHNTDEKLLKYAKDLITHLDTAITRNLPLYAVHGYCTDGGTAGAMIKHAIPEAAIIPLNYDVLKDQQFFSILSELNWVGIVDLEPFNQQTIDWYVDHHLSTVGKPINANRIRFDANGDSGAWQLYLSSFLPELPQKIVELAVMTRITDTAGYKSEPPLKQINDLSDLDFDSGNTDLFQQEQRIWLLDDGWASAYNLRDQLNLHQYLAKDGFYGLAKVIDNINNLREFRSTGVSMANQLSIDTDIVIFKFKSDTIDKFSLTRRLQKRGVKIVISLSETPNGYKISFRRNRNLSASENKKIQLQLLAAQLRGGGHAGASGGFANSYDEALNIIKQWANKNGLTISENILN